MDGTRVDKWLWAVRMFKTRTDATEACRGGHVKVNGSAAKPASPIAPGDRVEVRVRGRSRVVEVVRLIEKRVGAPIAAECFVDHTPPPTPEEQSGAAFARDRSAGRPTKRDRRELERLRRR